MGFFYFRLATCCKSAGQGAAMGFLGQPACNVLQIGVSGRSNGVPRATGLQRVANRRVRA